MSVFVNRNGAFTKLSEEHAKKSVNEISIYLGYSTDKVQSYLGGTGIKNSIEIVLLEMFTRNVIAVFTKSNLDFLPLDDLGEFMEDFEFEIEYGSYEVQESLLQAIENKSYDLEFLSRVLEFEASDENGEYYSEKIETRLFFINGFLASFRFGDDLNKWARHMKSLNPDIITNYAKEAKYYWGDNYEKIFKEINLQADAFAATPQAYENEFVQDHVTSFGNVDFIMLLVCHYNQKITIQQFKEINHCRHKLVKKTRHGEVYKKGNYKYEFDDKGILVKIKK